jgi:hypothetical protein
VFLLLLLLLLPIHACTAATMGPTQQLYFYSWGEDDVDFIVTAIAMIPAF